MSLLNEMLHNLAKQKLATQGTPLPIPVRIQKKDTRVLRAVFLCFALLLSLLLFFYIKQEPKTPLPTETSLEKPKEPALSVETPLLESYVEPLATSQFTQSEIQFEPISAQNDWNNSQAEPVAAVNKIYPNLTLEEWHNAQLNKALTAIDEGFDDQAIEILEAILIKIPNASDVRENLASMYLGYNDFTHANKIISDGLKIAPTDFALLSIKARMLLSQDKTQEAIQLLTKYRPSISAFPDFYGTLAAALQSAGRVVEAGSLYQSLLKIEPDNGQYWLGYAISLEHDHKSNQAIDAYAHASQSPDSDPQVIEYAAMRLKNLQG